MTKVNDPTTWNSFDACVAAYAKGGYNGLGFIFTEDDPYCGIDFDHVIDDNGRIENWATMLLERLNSYTEVSQSGTGLHVLVKAYSVKLNRRVMITGQGLEVYHSNRYFAITGNRLMEYPATIEPRDDVLQWLADTYMLQPKSVAATQKSTRCSVASNTQDAIPVKLTGDDHRAIERATRKYGDRFTQLMEGDLDAFGNDVSRADLSLCGMMAKVTSDPAIIERVWLATPFGKRDKVVRRPDYRMQTIQKAIDGTSHHTSTPHPPDVVGRHN